MKLIQLDSNNGEEYIGLTEKGKTVFGNLLQLNDLIKEEN